MFLFITFIFTGCNMTPATKPEKESTPSPLSLVNPSLFKLISVPSEEEIFALQKLKRRSFWLSIMNIFLKGSELTKLLRDT